MAEHIGRVAVNRRHCRDRAGGRALARVQAARLPLVTGYRASLPLATVAPRSGAGERATAGPNRASDDTAGLVEGGGADLSRWERLACRISGVDVAAWRQHIAAERAAFVRDARMIRPDIGGYEDILTELDRGRDE